MLEAEYQGIIEKLVESLHDIDTMAGFKRLLHETIDRLGYAHFAYHIIRSPATNHAGGRATFGLTSYPDVWSQHYLDSGFVHHDPVVARALASSKAFRWSTTLENQTFNRQQLQIMSDARDCGIQDGLTIPLSSRHGERAALTLGLSGDRPLTRSRIDIAQLVAEFFHAHALRRILHEEFQRNNKRRNSILSPRETQTMNWVARGKSSWEIAQILGIAEKSVEFYVDCAKRKLHASNRTHAVVKAAMLGLISDPTLKDETVVFSAGTYRPAEVG
jgi:DNA-binding CsgD family transcriptional regulator